ncbi:hypothetical protein LLH00_02535 [bacterium]|nr:hypothetical protein [bacterium]
MRINRKISITLTLTSLLCLAAGSLHSEMRQQRVPRGNNAGLGIGRVGGGGWAGPWYAAANNTIQFPTGSGNFIYNDCGLVTYMITRDTLGTDAFANDTIMPPDGGSGPVFLHASGFNYDEVMALATSEPNIERLGDVPYDRVWSSADAGELADWPIEGRWGRSASGEPMVYGAETMFVHYGDVACTYGYGTPPCMYSGYSFHFLDYGESANMVYINILFQNVSEYLRFNATGNYRRLGERCPSGYTFKGAIFIPYMRQVGFGSSDYNAGWAFQPSREIVGYWCKQPTISSFSPQEPPLMGYKVLRAPSIHGETATLRNAHIDVTSEFGISAPWGIVRSDYNQKDRYKFCLGENPQAFTSDRINPYTGRQLTFWPGLILPSDQCYEKWLWGLGGEYMQACLAPIYGELHDIAPRDTVSMEMVMMFAYPGVKPLVAPTADIANIDAPVMQQAFAPLERYAEVAQTVYESGFITPSTPVSPSLTIIPGDRQVTLTWSDVNLRTPDAYYSFLKQHPDLDPEGVYKEYDFEGYRLYRNYVGPNNAHAELIFSCSLSDNNLQFFYVDKFDNDRPYYRLRNGLRVWYALVPYDRNIDVATGNEFSLPDTSSAKVWNRPGESGLYTVVPRSEASNFKAAEVSQIRFIAVDGSSPEVASNVMLTGPGDGSLTDPPMDLVPLPFYEVNFTPVNNERLAAEKTIYLTVKDRLVYDQGCTGNRMAVDNTLTLVDGGYESTTTTVYGGGDDQPVFSVSGPVDGSGVNYSFKFTFDGMSGRGNYIGLYMHADPGGYNGGDLEVLSTRWCTPRPGTSPSNLYTTRAGRFQVTWKDAGGGNLTVEVKDMTRGGATVNKVDYPDERGWGFQTKAGYGGDIAQFGTGANGAYYNEAFVDRLPKSERTVKMDATLPADNIEQFGLFLNGLLWTVKRDGGDGITMPAAGTVWVIDNAYGSWNDNQTVFTQIPDMAFPGDKWEIKITPSSVNPEDADLSKIRVVPNPYVGSSFLDLTPDNKRIEFVNLPAKCTIRIYSLGGNLVNVLNHIGVNRFGWGNYTDWDRLTLNQPNEYTGYDNHGGTEAWNMRNRFGQTVASGLYFFHVTDERGKTYTGKFYVIN